MGISTSSALEIFTNPADLQITIGQEKEGAKFAIGIFRGPGHNFKPILTSAPFAETLEGAVKAVGNTLEEIRAAMVQQFADPKSFASQFVNPTDCPIDQSKVLNEDLIRRILDELRKNKVASTFDMVNTAG
jgi:hypothetical protein